MSPYTTFDYNSDLNDSSEVVRKVVLTQKEIHDFVAGRAEGDPIDFDVAIKDWGQVQEPYFAYYGQVATEEIAGLYIEYGSRLFSKNLRHFIESSSENIEISETLKEAPHNFWYFNNGITVLCSKIEKKPLGGADRSNGRFECKGVNVVNGAQTVGAIAKAFKLYPESARMAYVLVRFISLENCPENFANDVTRATNTQNQIGKRDFVTLDPEQLRLKRDLLLDLNKIYSFKSGDQIENLDQGCDLNDATIALACANSEFSLSVQVKREISKCWEDIHKNPYKMIFPKDLSAIKLWNCVQVMRKVDFFLGNIKSNFVRGDRKQLIAIHGNRFVLHRVFQGLNLDYSNPRLDWSIIQTQLGKSTQEEFAKLVAGVESLFEGAYIAPLFLNATKCKKLNTSVINIPPSTNA